MKYIACFSNHSDGYKVYGKLYLYNTFIKRMSDYEFILDSGADNMHIINNDNFLSSLDFMDLDERKHDIEGMERVELFHLKNKFVKTNIGSSIGIGTGYRGYIRSVQIDGLLFVNVKCTFVINRNRKLILFPFNMLGGNKILIDEKFNMLVEAKERVIISRYMKYERLISYKELNMDDRKNVVDHNTLIHYLNDVSFMNEK